MINKKKIGALILAGTMLLSMGTTAFAAGESTTPNVNQNGQVPITKKFEMADGLTTPAATFKFTATSQTPGALPATIADVSFTEGQTGTLKGEKYVLEGTTAISFQGTWPHAGEYVYTVTEKQESMPTTTVNNRTAAQEGDALDTLKEGEKKNLVGEYENKVTFTNTHQGGVVPTGILMNNLPFILLVAVAIVAFVSLAVIKRRRTSGK